MLFNDNMRSYLKNMKTNVDTYDNSPEEEDMLEQVVSESVDEDDLESE